MNLIVGSGPSAIACAHALLKAGGQVTLLDAGLVLEPERQGRLTRLTGKRPADWSAADTAFLKEGMTAGDAGIPLKRAYGSDFPYRHPLGATAVSCTNAETKPSFATGGLSTVWGSAVLPYRQQDLVGWPVTEKELAIGYRGVSEFMPLAARTDDLAALFPLYTERHAPLPASQQAEGFLAQLRQNQARLNGQGVFFGSSRLAVKAPGCVACGLCMYGCPLRLIYSTDSILPQLHATGRLHYRSGFTVTAVEEIGPRVRVHGVLRDGSRSTMEGDRAFLGAGLLNTTSILLRSLGLYDKPVPIFDSQYFLLPMLRLKGTKDVVRESLHTLAQAFVEILDPRVSPYTVHLQVYTYNELFREPVEAKLGRLRRYFPIEAFLGRLLLIQGYLHSAHSAKIEAALRKTNQGDELHLQGVENGQTHPILRRLVKKLVGLVPATGVVPLVPLLQLGPAGRGFHSGGSFPMSASPGEGQSDVLGRPYGFRRVHAVDSSVFSSIAATTITYTAMANAWRIGHLTAHGAGDGS